MKNNLDFNVSFVNCKNLQKGIWLGLLYFSLTQPARKNTKLAF